MILIFLMFFCSCDALGFADGACFCDASLTVCTVCTTYERSLLARLLVRLIRFSFILLSADVISLRPRTEDIFNLRARRERVSRVSRVKFQSRCTVKISTTSNFTSDFQFCFLNNTRTVAPTTGTPAFKLGTMIIVSTYDDI
jgi:hypothetical protein